MKITFFISVLIFNFLFLIPETNSQEYQDWKWQHQKPQGNTLRWVKVFDANTWYAVGFAGTFIKTTNGGTNWFFHHQASNEDADGAPNTLYSAHFFNQSTGIVCGTVGLTKTTNGGVTFDTISSGLPSAASWYNMFFLNSTTGYMAGTTSGRMASTTDAGNTWTLNTAIPSGTYYDIYAFNTNDIIITTTSGNIRKTTNAGLNWTQISTGASATIYAVNFLNADTGFVAGSGGTFRVTTNAGLNWTLVNTPSTSTMYQIKIFPGSPTEIYVIGDPFNLYKTTNMGANWTAVPNNGSQTWTSTYYSLDKVGSTMVLVGATGLINKSTNNGANWVNYNTWLSAGTFYDIWVENNDGKVWVVGSPGSTGNSFDQVLYTSNGGTNWINQNVGSSTRIYNSIYMVNSTTGYICGTLGAFRKTTNGGTNWDSIPVPMTLELNDVDFIDANTGWVFGQDGYVWMTTNGGTNWTQQPSGLTTQDIEGGDMVNASTGWFVGGSTSLRKTTNGGANWEIQTPNLPSTTIYDVDMIDANTGYISGSSGRVRKTTNGGTNWDTVTTPTTAALYRISFINVNTGVICGSSGFTARTTNGGQVWDIHYTAGSTMYALFMKHQDSIWSAGSISYVFKYAKGPTGTITFNNEIPSQYTLLQNYPNPFNPSTTIKFGIPKAGNVSLKVYNVTGQLVKTLFNNIPLNAGTVTYDFDGSNFASGIYFYTLIVDNNKIDTKKMVLVK